MKSKRRKTQKQEHKKALESKKNRQRLMWGIGILGVVLILVAAVLAYIQSSWPQDIRVAQASR